MSNQSYYGGGAPNQGSQNPNQQYNSPNQQQYGGAPQYGGASQYGGQQPSGPPQQWASPTGAPPGHRPPQRVGTDAGLPQGRERSEQVEHLQNYEAHALKTTSDQDQETLRKEFPNVDSSLIAALYADSDSLSATREMLDVLSSGT
jgi:hypothetical protein